MPLAPSRLILIGWHGASWKTLHPLVDAGLLPHLDSLIRRGVVANVNGIGPSIAPIVWTSIATGKLGGDHGILGAFETDRRSGRVRLAGCSGRKVKALWNIAMQSGRTAHVAGWLATFPAEPLNGSCVANEFAVPVGATAEPWPIVPRSIHPHSLEATAAALRLHPSEMSRADMSPLIDYVDEIDQMQDLRPFELADFLARDVSMHAIACSILESRPWDLLMLGWHAFDRACHRFMQYAPPRMAAVTDADERHYGKVVTRVLRFQDMLLGRLIHLAGPDTAFMLVSPAGFRSGDERPSSKPLQQAGGSWYLPQGILCMAGAQVASDELVHGVTMLDIAPLALTLLGLPAADDMPGRIVNSAFVPEFTPLPRIPSWEPVPGDCGMHPQESVQEREEAAAALANLFAAGYSDPQPAEQVSTLLERHGQCNLGLLHLSVGRFQEARDVFKRLSETEPRVGGGPRDPAIPIYLAHSQLLCGDRRGFRKTRQQIPRDHPLALLVGLMESHVELAEGNREAALAAIERAESSEFPWLLFGAAILYLRIGAWEEAEARLRRTIELDPAMRHARTALSWVLTQRGKGEEAAEVALKDVQLDYSSAFSHFALGLAMVARRRRPGVGGVRAGCIPPASLDRPTRVGGGGASSQEPAGGRAHVSDLIIRPPRESEFAAIRALLPETAADPARLFHLVFAPRPVPAIVGALSYQDLGDSLSGLRLHVVQDRRRSRIGTQMVDFVADQARQLGRRAVYADADIKNEPAAEPFLKSAGFSIAGTLTAVETDVEPLVAQSHRFEERLAKAEGFPEGSRVVSMEEAPHDQILKMHGDYIAHAPMLAGLLRDFHPEQYPESVVLMMGDRVIAFAMVQVTGDVFYVPAWVTLPEYRGRRIGALLFQVVGDSMRTRYAPGSINRVRFEYLDAAVYTAKLVREYGHTIIRIAARFERKLTENE